MTEVIHPYAVEWEEGSPVPAAPPFPKNGSKYEEEYTDESHRSHVGRIWNAVLIHGPITAHDLKSKIPWDTLAAVFREYALHHGIRLERAEDKQYQTPAVDWYHAQRVKQCVVRGWLKEDADGLLTVGTRPPGHEEMTQSQIEHEVLNLDPDKALEILLKKTDPARMKPDAKRREAMKESIATVGLLDRYIRKWTAPRQVNGQPVVVIVNGKTRMELLKELHAEGRLEYFKQHEPDRIKILDDPVPSDTPVGKVLLYRIQHELHGTSKDTSEAGWQAYAKALAAEGWTHQQIADAVGISRSWVTRVLSQMFVEEPVGQSDPREEKRKQRVEVIALHKEGWSIRRITGRTQIPRMTVQRLIKEAEEAERIAAEKAAAGEEVEQEVDQEEEEPDRTQKLGTNSEQANILAVTVHLGRATQKDVENHVGYRYGGDRWKRLVSNGYLEYDGNKAKAKYYKATSKGLIEADHHKCPPPVVKTTPPPPAPTPPTPPEPTTIQEPSPTCTCVTCPECGGNIVHEA